MTATFDSRGPTITPAEVSAFEATLPKPLPPDYRAFLLDQNGGSTHLWWPPEVGAVSLTIEMIYSLGEVEDYQSLLGARDSFEDVLPGVFLPIGEDPGGAQICLSLQDEDYGAIWLYDPELEYDPAESPDPDLLTPICGSFNQLIATLERAPDFEGAERRVAAARGQ